MKSGELELCPSCQECELKYIMGAGHREDDYECVGAVCPNCGWVQE